MKGKWGNINIMGQGLLFNKESYSLMLDLKRMLMNNKPKHTERSWLNDSKVLFEFVCFKFTCMDKPIN